MNEIRSVPTYAPDERSKYVVETRLDLVMANFPVSAENWLKTGEPKRDRRGRVKNKKDGSPQLVYAGKEDFSDPYERFEFGAPPFSNGDFSFPQHLVASMNENGTAGYYDHIDALKIRLIFEF